MLDIQKLRQDTNGSSQVYHFNNAGAALPPNTVTETMIHYLQQESLHGGYELAGNHESQIQKVYKSIATLIQSHQDEIAFVDSGTRSWNTFVYSLQFKPGDTILTSCSEYGNNVTSLRYICSKTGAKLAIIKNDINGQVCLTDLKKQLNSSVKLVTITHVPCNNGVVNSIIEIGKIVKETNAYYLVDACQSIGQIDINVQNILCDALVATGRKWLRGPRGTGFLYVNKQTCSQVQPAQIQQYSLLYPENILKDLYLREDAKKFELAEKNIAALLGLGAATDYALKLGLGNIEKHICDLGETLRQKVSQIKGVYICDVGIKKSGIVTFYVEGINELLIRKTLHTENINVSVMPSHYTPFGGYKNIIRASPHYYITENDIDHFCKILTKVLKTKL